VKTYPFQVVQVRLLGMGQSKAHQWLHLRLVVLRAAIRAWGDAPARSLAALAKRLGVAEAEAAALVVPLAEPVSPASPPAAAPPPVAPSPLLGMTGSNGASSVPRIRLRRRAVIAVRKQATR